VGVVPVAAYVVGRSRSGLRTSLCRTGLRWPASSARPPVPGLRWLACGGRSAVAGRLRYWPPT